MRFEPGFLSALRQDIANVRPDIKQRLARKGALSEEKLLSLVTDASSIEIDAEHAYSSEVVNYDSLTSWQPACDAVRDGKVAFVVLAGGRSSQTDNPLAFMALPKLGFPLMVNNLFQSGFVTHEGETIQAPAWFMTSPGLMERFANQLNCLSLMKEGVIFEQFESYRLGVDNRLRFNDNDAPELCTTGTGDLGDALVESGVLDDNPKVEHVVVINCNNMLASLDPLILTHHIESGTRVTCEVIDGNEQGCGVMGWSNNKLQIIDDFRLDPTFVEEASYYNTNSMIITVDTLRAEMDWRYNKRRRQAGKRLVVQYERQLHQYTEVFPTQFVLVDGVRRFMPVKTESDLAKADTILNGNRK